MDIYEFINSRDIREHCRKLGHKFNTMEAAFIVWDSANHTLKQKHAAWEEIIKTMPDMPMRPLCLRYTNLDLSVHEFLRRYMDIEDDLVGKFYMTESEYIYYCETLYKADINGAGYCEPSSYSATFNACYRSAKTAADGYEIADFCITKKMINVRAKTAKTPEIAAHFNGDGKILSVYAAYYRDFPSEHILDKDEENIFHMFENMWFIVPTPFKKGDIVFQGNGKTFIDEGGQPFVFDKLCYEIDERYAEELKLLNKRISGWSGDYSDMTAYGYFIADNGLIYRECTHMYLNLEYYRNELTGYNRILKPIRSFVKGQIDIALLLDSYYIIRNEEDIKNERNHLGYTNEGLWFAGLSEE